MPKMRGRNGKDGCGFDGGLRKSCNFANDMDEKSIKETLLKGERVTLECKKAKAEVPKSIWQTYSAFANTIGGLILLGVDEDLQEKDISKRLETQRLVIRRSKICFV